MTCETYLSLWATLWTIAGALAFGLLLLTGAVYWIIRLFRWMDEEVNNPPTLPPDPLQQWLSQAWKIGKGTWILRGGGEQDDD